MCAKRTCLYNPLLRNSCKFRLTIYLLNRLNGEENKYEFSTETAIGALSHYVSNETVDSFQPMNVNFGIMEPLGYRVKGKQEKNKKISERSLEIIKNNFLEKN